ncbi:MAG: hypothetical protein EHM91_07205 [Planctomycetota bacterium]|nr:MAG: hypothetical protein EHM91_07205 [Planctomycetota bacterium]
MTTRATALFFILAGLSACREPIAVDTRAAEGIPSKIAIEGLRELLPKVVYLSCGDPRVEISRSEVTSWAVDEKGVELRTRAGLSHRLAFSSVRGADLAKLPLSVELRVFVATPKDPRKDLFRFSWREEEPARRCLEYFEALREDR